VSVKGHLADGRSYSVRLDTASHSSRLIVRAFVGKAKFGEVTLDLGRYPEMEVLPIVGVSPEGVELIFRFGDYRTSCFLNDDGRDRVMVWLSKEGTPKVSLTSFEDCEKSMN
jgi:hypothetical protein